MFAAMDFGREGLPILMGVCFLFLGLLFLTMWLTRTLEVKLVIAGILTALLAVFCDGVMGSGGAGLQVSGVPGQTTVHLGGEATRVLGRIALLLVLGGIGIALFARWSAVCVTPTREEVRRDNLM